MPEYIPLAERMQQAADRVAAVHAQAGLGRPPRPRPAPSPGAAEVPHWQLGARPGEDVFLMPGQLHFGGQAASLRTLLGSCVAVTLWHPTQRLGAMCHFLLPMRARSSSDPPDGRYGDEAMQVLLEHMQRAGTEPHEYEAHLYGGADTLPEGSNLRFNVGERNIEAAWRFVDRWGLQLQGVDVGEDVPRTVTLTVASGVVEVRRGPGREPPLRLPPRPPLPALDAQAPKTRGTP
jgi:chemotaxis protein CheD